MAFDPRPIGVFDSGVGGISVLKALCKRLPHERFLYFGDSANAPYGTKSKEQILDLSRRAVERLRLQKVKAIVIACNTATAAAAEPLRAQFPDLPILGVEPAIRPAALSSNHPRVLIMATPMTLQMEKFQSLKRDLSDLAEFQSLPCPGLVELIEKGPLDSPEISEFLAALLAPVINPAPNAVVLGCTHYPFVLPLLRKLLPDGTAFFDGADGTARQLEKRLLEKGLLCSRQEQGEVVFLSSSTKEDAIPLMKRLFDSFPS